MSVVTFGKLTIVLFLALLASPVSVLAQEESATIMSFEEAAKLRRSFPYIVEIQVGKGALLYFGAQHTNDPQHPQIAQIESLWKEFRPTVAYNEGGNPPVLKSVEEAVSRIGEAGLVRLLAARDKIPVHSLEPSRTDEVAMLLKTYTAEQLKVFYALRQAAQFRNGKHDETVEAYIEFVLKNLANVPGLEGVPNSLRELEKSCLWLSPKLQNWREVPQSWFDPSDSQAYTNRVSRLSSEFRDPHMVKLLIDEVKQGKRVFAVVGGSHVVMQERALRAVLESK